MPPNSKSKFVGFSIILPCVIVCLLVAAIGSPDWKTFSKSNSDEMRWGLFASCTGSHCTKYKDWASASVSFGDATCAHERNDVVDRMNATAGLLIGAVILTFLTALPQVLHAVGCTTIAKRGHATIAWVLCLATAMSFTGVVVYGATTSNWMGCGRDVCDPHDNSTTSCGVGFSFIFAIVGTMLLAFATLLVLLYTYRPNSLHPSGDVVFAVTSISITSIVLTCVAVGTEQWHLIVPDFQRNGLFQVCTPADCNRYTYDSSRVTTMTGCVRELNNRAGFHVTSATLLIAAASIMAVFALVFTALYFSNKPIILFTRSRKWFVIVLLAFVEVLQLIAFVLQENFYDSWWLCGTEFCSMYTGFCSFGMSYGFVIVTLVLTAILIATHYFELHDWCCFNEKFASGRHNFTFKEAFETITERSPRKPLGSSSRRPAPPVPPTATAQAAANMTVTSGPTATATVSTRRAEDGGSTAHEPSSALDSTVALPPGDWEYDSVSGYYWCEQIFLFYDPETRQYYDPSTDQWINTENNNSTNPTSASSPSQRQVAVV